MEILLLGFVIGMRHAMDADHLSAVATLVAQRVGSVRDSVRQGVFWGLGHTLTLFLFALLVMLSGNQIPDRLASALEWTVGLMLVWLGADLVKRLRSQRIHLHPHQHADGTFHLHAHRHDGEAGDAGSSAEHDHPHPVAQSGFRALLVGVMHGLAGSAALLLLVLSAEQSIWQGLLYVVVFGLGTLLGMACLTLVIALPLKLSAQRFTGLFSGLQFAIALFSIGLGGVLLYQQSGWLVG